jgi:hypothetical protein
LNNNFREGFSKIPATIGHALMGLVREMAPVVLFFFIVFGLFGLLYKLFVSQYAIEFSAFTKAAIAALIMGKVVLLLDWAGTGNRFEREFPRAVVILVKTIIYALAVIAVGMGEKIHRAVHEAGSFNAGINQLIADANVDRFLGFVLLISLIVAFYLMVQEISRAMGKGALLKLFFEPPANKSEPL